jgi:hypothetical protein
MRSWRHLVAPVIFPATAALFGCDSGGTECVCSAAGITVTLPKSLAGLLTQAATSGAACQAAVVDPPPVASVRATVFHIEPVQPGPCHIDLFFRDGTTFSEDFTIIQATGCCGGLRTAPPGAAEVSVPPPSDAGGTDD